MLIRLTRVPSRRAVRPGPRLALVLAGATVAVLAATTGLASSAGAIPVPARIPIDQPLGDVTVAPAAEALSVVPVAGARWATAPRNPAVRRVGTSAEGFAAAVRTLQPYVHRTPRGTFTLDAPHGVIAGIPAAVYAQIRQSSRLVNLDIAAGRLISRPDGRIVLPAAALPRTARPLPAGAVAGGTSRISVQWWGVVIHLDPDAAAQLLAALAGAATAAAVVSALVSAGVISAAAAVPLAIISGVLAVVTAALRACLGAGGLDLSITWLGLGWCAPAARP